MKITPLDLKKQEFKKTMRGYDSHEVDAFLDMVAKELEELLKENSVLTERLRELDSKVDDYRKMERTLQGTLTSAQKTADDLRKNAEKEAELIVRNTKIQSTHLVEEARAKMADLRAEISALEEQKEVFIARFKSMIDIQQRLLEAHSSRDKKPSVEPAPKAPPETMVAGTESHAALGSDYTRLSNMLLDPEPGEIRKTNPEQ